MDDLVNIFRFTAKNEESQNHEDSIRQGNLHTIRCIDLRGALLEKKIIEDGDDPWNRLQPILFERVMIENYGSFKEVEYKITADKKVDDDFQPMDNHILRYLYGCYYRLERIRSLNAGHHNPKFDEAENIILDQVILYLTEPDLFPDRDKRFKNNSQVPILLNIIHHYLSKSGFLHSEPMQKFVNSLGEKCKTSETGYQAIIDPTYARLSQKFVSMAIDDPSLQEWFNIVRIFMQQPDLTAKLLEKNILKKDNSISYQSTLLGFMMSISPLPRTSQIETTFFKNPIRYGESDHKFTETQLGIKLHLVGQELHKIFHTWLKLPTTRNLFLSWIGRCLHTFKDRKKLWNNQLLLNSATAISITDGFLMNFLTVMLHLSEPFAGPYNSDLNLDQPFSVDKKMLKVDPRYCKWSKSTHEGCPVHFLGLAEETFLIKSESTKSEHDEATVSFIQPSFISECFFGTHQAFTYGFRSIYERCFKLAQSISELQHAYADAMAHPAPGSMSGPDPREIIKDRMDLAMSQFFNLKAVLMTPDLVKMQMHFCVATAAYLNHLVVCKTYEEATNSKEFRKVSLSDLKKENISKVCLEYIPEMLVENILDFFLFLKHFNEQALARYSAILEPIMTLMVTFMGNSSLMQNPHLRARFAEILECLMPRQSHHGQAYIGCASLFESHPLIDALAPSLVNVFVGIEMTGQGVQFEQKFSYRRPMYVVLEYLWNKPMHRQILIQLAEEAEINIESSRPPLFLRFINLLMNDAIFLLDEALGYMNQLKEGERRRNTEEWHKMSAQQRAQAEASYSHIGRLARFHNVLSLSTIGTLSWLTSEIKTIFCHPTLIDRIANMLNYFLEHLVGPKKGKFNVSDKNDYEFKPREVLEKICQIYINLGCSESNRKYREFCTAVSSDGRSYSKNLLPQAIDILFRTGMNSLGSEFEKLSQQVQAIAIRNQLDEIQTEDIPDTFLDPIMSTLMLDPVMLPSSKMIVDRSTIARHLLSDQTDPFNRSPLSMEDIIPEVDLKNQIECFLKERRDAQRQERERANQ